MMPRRRQEHGWAGGGEVGVGGFLFVTARRSRNPHGEKFFEKCLSVHVSIGNLRREKFFKKFLSAQVVPGALARTRYQPKPARNGHAGGAWCAGSRTLPAETCAKWPCGGGRCASSPPVRGEKLETKFLSAHVSTRNPREEKLFEKYLSTQVSASPDRAKKVPKRNLWPS